MNKSEKKEEIKDKLISLQENGDTEDAHGQADDLLCELLKYLGCNEIVSEYHKVDKWYA